MRRRMRHSRLGSTLAVVTLVLQTLSCGPDSSEDAIRPPVPAVTTPYRPIDVGRAHYVRYCASCHGSDGRGDGPVAEALKDRPTDVTKLRTDSGGEFSVDELVEVIRGRKDVRAHGTREMPVWGNIWGDDDLTDATPEQIETRINELVEYIRSIQE